MSGGIFTPAHLLHGETLAPIADNVWIEPDAEPKTTKGGLLLPDTARKVKPQRGKVLAVGPGRFNDALGALVPMTVQVGDYVLFKRYGGSEIQDEEMKTDEEYYRVMREDEILGVIRKAK
jgi:chaperonin GroES